MSSLTKVLAEEVRKIEETAAVDRTVQKDRLTHHLIEQVQRALTGFAAGVMVAASVWSLLIPAIEQSESVFSLLKQRSWRRKEKLPERSQQ